MENVKILRDKIEIGELLENYSQKDVKISFIRKYYNQSLFGNQINLNEFNEIVNEFLLTALFQMNSIDMNTVIYNLKNLTIRKYPISYFENQKIEHYYPYPNIIDICDSNYHQIDMIHSLLHMSSRYLDEEELHLGFSFLVKENNNYQEWGRGFNEGYVAILEKKYFPKYTYIKRYALQQRVMNVIEYVIGQEKVEKYFFEANMSDLIKDLELYLPRERVIQLIRNLDFITENNNLKNCFLKSELNKKVKEINTILREIAFGYFDRLEQIDPKLVDIIENNQLKYYVYLDKKYPILQKKHQYQI